MKPRTVTILGSTGSVGFNTLEVAGRHRASFKVEGLAAAGRRVEMLRKQIDDFHPKAVFLKEETAAVALRREYGKRLRVFTEKEGLRAFTAYLDSDILMAATTGTSGLRSVIDALKRGRRVALANKEILVAAGSLVMSALKKNKKASLIPVDSEHSAIFQCLQGQPRESVRRLILTGSGGPLREIAEAKFGDLTKEDVINHPEWKMGKKISVDSATLMNKGLELIEARWLFDIPVERIDVLIHPEAVIHSMVEFEDGAVMAQLGVTCMKLPIQYAMSFPERLASPPEASIDFHTLKSLSFAPPDRKKFPCLDLAYAAARRSGSAPCVLSAADEVAVGSYLEDGIRFLQIPSIIEKVLSRHRHVPDPGLSEIQSIHEWAVEETKRLCQA